MLTEGAGPKEDCDEEEENDESEDFDSAHGRHDGGSSEERRGIK